jgi:hypothetical protein
MLIRNVRFTPQSGHAQRQHRCLLSAKSGHLRILKRYVQDLSANRRLPLLKVQMQMSPMRIVAWGQAP